MRTFLAIFLILVSLSLTGLAIPMALLEAEAYLHDETEHGGFAHHVTSKDIVTYQQGNRMEPRIRGLTHEWLRDGQTFRASFKKGILDDTWDREQFQAKQHVKYKVAMATFLHIRTQLLPAQLSTKQWIVPERVFSEGSSYQAQTV